jgi:hypothetical protein
LSNRQATRSPRHRQLGALKLMEKSLQSLVEIGPGDQQVYPFDYCGIANLIRVLLSARRAPIVSTFQKNPGILEMMPVKTCETDRT